MLDYRIRECDVLDAKIRLAHNCVTTYALYKLRNNIAIFTKSILSVCFMEP